MSRSLTRPVQQEIDAIQDALITSDLPPKDRLRLRAVLAWANGKTTREVAKAVAPKMSDFTVRKAIHRYRAGGLGAFTSPAPHKRGGKAPIGPEKEMFIVESLRRAIATGTDLTYRELSAQTGVSIATISALAKSKKLDPAHRRGPVAGTRPDALRGDST